MAAFERSWNDVIDRLESLQKVRVAEMRSKLASIVDSNSNNLEGADQMLQKALTTKGMGLCGAVEAGQAFDELVRAGLDLD